MRLTNRYGLPEALVRAVESDPYYSGGADFTATGLTTPPQVAALRRIHWRQITEDVSERVWALLGSAVHEILDRAATPPKARILRGLLRGLEYLRDEGTADGLDLGINAAEAVERVRLALHAIPTPGGVVTERRLFAEFNGVTVSAQLDRILYENRSVEEWKISSVWTFVYGGREEWVQQMNIQAEILDRCGYPPERLRVIGICRDWTDSKARQRKEGDSYPPVPVAVLSAPLWPKERREDFILERIRLHQRAQLGDVAECTPEDRWAKPDEYAVVPVGGKKAVSGGLHESREKAEAMVERLRKVNPKKQFDVVHRPGESPRCKDFCPVGKDTGFCPQWRALQKEAA